MMFSIKGILMALGFLPMVFGGTIQPVTITSVDAMSLTQRLAFKSSEIVKQKFNQDYTSPTYGVTIHVVSVGLIAGGVEIYAQGSMGGVPLGFGPNHTTETEHFRFFNPPIFVPDGTFTNELRPNPITGVMDTIVAIPNFVEDPKTAILESLASAMRITGTPGTAIKGTVGNTTDTFYPDGGVAVPDDDVFVVDAVWATVHDASSGTARTPAADGTYSEGLYTGAVYVIDRDFYNFDTSSIPDTDTVSSATYSIWVAAFVGSGGSQTYKIYESTAASSIDVAGGTDYSKVTTTAISDTAPLISAMSVGGYNDFGFNSTGIAFVNKTGQTKIVAREATYDVANIAPPNNTTYLNLSTSLNSGTSQDPKLVVVHSAASAGAPPKGDEYMMEFQ